jgi:predicted GNAT family acetyltransferase
MKAEVIHKNNRFVRSVDGHEIELEYMIQEDGYINFFHTYVPEPLRGRGLAMDIIKRGLDYAVDKKFKIIPSCSAVRIFIQRHPEYQAYTL